MNTYNKFKTKLPWQELCTLASVLKKSGGNMRIVGGTVRDLLLGRTPKDFDVITGIMPEAVMQALQESGYTAIPTGLKYGTITAIINKRIFEVTTLRKDVECYGRKAAVEFTDNWIEDASRRDFTVNALSMDMDGNIYDYFNGREDLGAKLVKFIGYPQERIKEDYLRILRYFRFCAYLGAENIDQGSMRSAASLAHHVRELSPERVRAEIIKLLGAQYTKPVINLMVKHNIFVASGIPFNHTLEEAELGQDPLINFAVLCIINRLDAQNLKGITSALRFSNQDASCIFNMCLPQPEVDISAPIDEQKQYIYILGKTNYKHILKIHELLNPGVDLQKLHALAAEWQIPKFPLKGDPLIPIVTDHRNIGKYLDMAERYWMKKQFKPSQSVLINYIKEHM